uniref:uncharacterized protein n=1 Tax=Myxine glutinosa TaxID=7769 RepID=UPI00358E4945
MVRKKSTNHILQCRDLFHQFIVDMYAKIESERLLFIRLHQRQLRAESYAHLKDAVNNDGDVQDMGQLVILPTTFTGGPRYMHEWTQDAMAYVRNYGRPDLFLTFTCNPKWEEIIRCFMYTIEWQKLGLPHAHILVWLEEKIHASNVDSFISAELPNPDEDPELFNIFKTQMVHGPCGYPLYQRRKPESGGSETSISISETRSIDVDNQWIVPYCPLLSKMFKAHLNVEFCNSMKSIKYMCKYVNKDEFAKTLIYNEVPQNYTRVVGSKTWKRCTQGARVVGYPDIRRSDAIGRVYTVHPNNFECFFLYLLLHHVKGPISFQELRTFNGQVCDTFRQACHLHGLLEDDSYWDATLEEAAVSRSPALLRNLFAIMLQTCGLSNPVQLWNNHREDLNEDILHRARQVHAEADDSDVIYNEALILIEDKLLSLGGHSLEVIGLPVTQRQQQNHLAREVLRETSYNAQELENYINENEPRLTVEQEQIYMQVLASIHSSEGGLFILDAPGGTGKTFLINLLLSKIRHKKMIALAVASSGIAATHLTGGQTAHSTFKLPLNLTNTEQPMCNISKSSAVAEVFWQCQLSVWDECTMSHRVALEAVDRTLQDIRNDQTVMGGITLLMAGDFRQTLPVIPRGTRQMNFVPV